MGSHPFSKRSGSQASQANRRRSTRVELAIPVILSGRDADYLHQCFPMGSCLAVLNKYETRQRAVLDMVFGALQRKCCC